MSIQNKQTPNNQNQNQNKNQTPPNSANKTEPGKPGVSNVAGQPKKDAEPKAPESKPTHS